MEVVSGERCWICRTLLGKPTRRAIGDWNPFNCPRCGEYSLTATTIMMIEHDPQPYTDLQRAILSHAVRKRRRGLKPAYTQAELDDILKDERLPTVTEQADALVLLLGELLDGPGANIDLFDVHHGAILGTLNADNFDFVVRGLHSAGLFQSKGPISGGECTGTLTFQGWERFQELRRGRARGLRAFMAMKFGNASLTRVYADHFQPAARAAGFDLRKVNEEPSPGLIDNRIRVDILESRFVVADLSDDNLGAYWEAGYAEGLGKPVIYTCEKLKFEATPTHFDTNHSLTIMWDAEDPGPAAELLKATIRKTFPGEARMSDDATA